MSRVSDQLALLHEFVVHNNLGPPGNEAISFFNATTQTQTERNFALATTRLALLVNIAPEQLHTLFNQYLSICELKDRSDDLKLTIYTSLSAYYLKTLLSIDFNLQNDLRYKYALLTKITAAQIDNNVDAYINSRYVRNLLAAQNELRAHIQAVELGEEGPEPGFVVRYGNEITKAFFVLSVTIFLIGVALGFLVVYFLEIPVAMLILPAAGYLLGNYVLSLGDFVTRKNDEFKAEQDIYKANYTAQISALDDNIKAGINCKSLMKVPEYEPTNNPKSKRHHGFFDHTDLEQQNEPSNDMNVELELSI